MFFIQREMYTVNVDESTGRILEFKGASHSTNLIGYSDGIRPICYTRPADSLIDGEKPLMTPWVDRSADWEKVYALKDAMRLENNTLGLQGKIEFHNDYFQIAIRQTRQLVRQIGLNLPLNFVGKKGGDYRNQLIPTTPYTSEDTHYFYLDSPEGQRLLILAQGAAAWKLDYSEYACGHYIKNLKWLFHLDPVYGSKQKALEMQISVFCVNSFVQGLRRISEHLHLPIAYASSYCAAANSAIPIAIIGKVNEVALMQDESEVSRYRIYDNKVTVYLPSPGVFQVVPLDDKQQGLSCTVGALATYKELLQRNLDALRAPYHCDMGLCEGGVWAQAACVRQRICGVDSSLQKKIEEQIENITQKRIPRCSVPNKNVDGWPAYHVYASLRTQEGFFGVAFFLEAYKAFGKCEYLEYAVSMMDTLLKYDALSTGEIISAKELGSKQYVDYTTVTAPVLVVVDLAIELQKREDSRYKRYAVFAEQVADYLVVRGVCFPTEGEVSAQVEPEMEEGSISCTALSVLYVAYWIRNKPEYIPFAQKILRLHDSWRIQTPDVRMNGGTMRWWETLWEGDQNGPAICAGHAWGLWRAEADFYYGLLTNDASAFLKSYNGFACNLIKIQPDGTSYACYQPDMIPGGGFHKYAQDVEHRIKGGYPKTPDQSLSKYLWVRLQKTWANTCVIYQDNAGEVHSLNAQIMCSKENALKIKETVTKVKHIINLTSFEIQVCK